MSDFDANIPTAFDPFTEANAEDSGNPYYKQRNGRKSLTTVQGLKKEFSYNKILKDLKKEFAVMVQLFRPYNFKVISGKMFQLSWFRLAL